METTLHKSPTKEKILGSAIKLMLVRGFTATSVDDIVRDAGITKGSFFHFFESKEALAMAALERFVRDQYAKLESAPFNKERDPVKRVMGRIDTTIALLRDPMIKLKSCLIGNFSQELAPTHSGFQSLCAEKFSQMSKAFVRDLKAAGVKDASHVCDMYFSLIQGSMILMKAKSDHSIATNNLKLFKEYLKGRMKGLKL